MFQWLVRLFQGGRTIRDLAHHLGCSTDDLILMPISYSRFTIPKRSGGRREILAPAEELKAMQKRIARRLLGRFRAHPAAMAYERGRSILQNALPHAQQEIVLRMDLVDFFPSIGEDKVTIFFRRAGWGRKATDLLVRLTTVDGYLPQGAPTSPRLSNLVNKGLDLRLASLARACGFAYTRYADDLTFSSFDAERHELHGFLRVTKKILAEQGYRVHRRKKLSVRRPHQRQMVTGLVVNDRPRLPRETRRWLRAVRHRFMKGEEITISESQLMGWIGIQRMLGEL